MWFKSHPRNQSETVAIWRLFCFHYGLDLYPLLTVMSHLAHNLEGEAVVNDVPVARQSRRADRSIFSAEKMQDHVVQMISKSSIRIAIPFIIVVWLWGHI